jgi:hypothetical protein
MIGPRSRLTREGVRTLRAQELGRRIGAHFAQSMGTFLANQEPQLQGAAMVEATMEAIVTIGSTLLGETVAPDRLDEILDELELRLRSRAHLVAEEVDKRQATWRAQ